MTQTFKYMVWLYHKKALGYSNMLQVCCDGLLCRLECVAGPRADALHLRSGASCQAPGQQLEELEEALGKTLRVSRALWLTWASRAVS